MVIQDEKVSCNQKESTENCSSEAYKNQSSPVSFCEARMPAFNTLALWSGTAWTSTKVRNSLHSTALSEWVHHQRIWMAVDKATISEIIGSVRGVIPSSKLASYGDFRYDLDFEEMYDILDDVNAEISFINDCYIAAFKDQNLKASDQVAKNLESFENNAKESLLEDTLLEKNTSSNDEKRNAKMDRKNNNLKINCSGFEEWISKCQTLLRIVRRIVIQENSFDVWSEVLLKTCSKFLFALKCNASLSKVMEADVPLITDYRQLLTEPITILEVLSLPQPYLDDNLDLDIEQGDTLWLKLSSPSIKKLWGKKQNGRQQEKEPSKNNDSPNSDSWLGTTNFLRRQRQTKSAATSKEEIEIPDTEARDLLGSLFNIIDCRDGLKMETTEAENKSDIPTTSKTKNYFPEAHGEWTRTLFPRRVNAQIEANANVPNNGSIYFQHQINRQVFYKPILPPPVSFPPPLFVPPPLLYSQPSQRLPFYLPSSNQPVQNYNCEKVHLSLPQNYVIGSRPLANDNQQFLTTVPSFSFQHSAGAGLHVQQVSRYSQSLSNCTLQPNVSRIPLAKQRSVIQENVLTMKSTQLYQGHLTNMDKTATQHNENFIKEVMKSKLVPSISSRISDSSKLPLQAHKLYQHHSGYPFQPTVNSVKNTKSDSSRVRNTLTWCPQSIISSMSSVTYNAAKFTNLKPFLSDTSEGKKVEEANVPSHRKRAPLVSYNHQRSPIIENIRRDLPSTFLFKKDIPYNRQKVLAEKLLQTMITNADNNAQEDFKKLVFTLKQSENGINDNNLEFADDSEQYSSRNKNVRNVLKENRYYLSIFDNALTDNKGNCSNSYNDVKINQIRGKLMFNSKLKPMAKKKKMIKRYIRFDQNKIMLLLYKNMKAHNISRMDSIYKCIWDCIKLHKKDSCLIKTILEIHQCLMIQKYRNEKIGFKVYKNDRRRALKILKNINKIKQEVHINGSQKVISYIMNSKTPCNKDNDMFKDGWLSDEIHDQKFKNIFLNQCDKMNSNQQNIKKCIENNNCLNAELLNSMAENLFFSDDIATSRPTSFKSEKINGWTYFKIAIQIIVRNSSKILMNRKCNKQLLNHSLKLDKR